MLFKILPGLYTSARTVADALEVHRSSRLEAPEALHATLQRLCASLASKHCGGARISPEGPVTCTYGGGGTARGSK